MSKSNMKLIIILMSLATIGLLGFQFYWISNALRINEERFEQNIYQSLNTVVSQLEKGETNDIFLNYLAQDTTLQQSLFEPIEPIEIQISQRPVIRRRPSLVDSMMQMPIPQFSQRFRRIIEAARIDIEIFNDWENVLGNLTPERASSIFTPDELQVLLQERERQFDYLNEVERNRRNFYNRPREVETELEVNLPRDFYDKIRRTNLKIEAMNQAWEEILGGQKDVLSRLDTNFVRQLMANILQARGLEQVFELAIIDDKKGIIPITSVKDNFKLLREGQQARLFPSDIVGRENYLVINFPEKKQYIINQVWIPVMSSLIFVGIIISCFIYAIKVIIRQKNLSEIKNDFINNMTHEFKTPIATVSLAVEALQDPELINQDTFRNRYLSIIKDENKRLGAQVEKVLQSATLDKKDFKLKIEPIDINELISTAKKQIELQVENKGGKITYDTNIANTWIQGDHFHLSHMINNLLDNSIKYAKDKPTIDIKSWDDADHVFISIEDNGIGMSKDAVKKIFDKFYRVPTGNLHDVKGFGLGLSYVKTMLEAHHGDIQVSSELGKGSTFTLKLPRKQ